jgi:putative CRISPR-associated protein (TIGR02619 family)
MKNLLFVTVGVSALEAPGRIRRADRTRGSDLDPLIDSIEEFRKEKGDAKAAKGDALFDPLLSVHLKFWGQPKIPWGDPGAGRRTSAELMTTAVLLRNLAQTQLRVDRIILLVPKTPEGELASRVAQKVMESHEYRSHCGAPEVRTRSIPGIAEKEAMERLPDALLCAVAENRESEADRIIFNATAGYGATLIVVGMLALRYGFRMYYQHESMASPIFISQNLNIGWSPSTWILS